MAHILINLSDETISAITDARGHTCEKRNPSKENNIAFLVSDITEEGVKQFVKLLKMTDLKVWTKKIKKDVLTSQNQNSTRSCSVLKKRLTEQMIESGLQKFLDRLAPTTSDLKLALKRMGAEPSGEKREHLKKQLIQEVEMYGVEVFFNQFSVAKLHEMAEELELTIASNSKTILVRCIANMVDYIPPGTKYVLEFSDDDGKDYEDEEIEDVPIEDSTEEEVVDMEDESPVKPPKKRKHKGKKDTPPKKKVQKVASDKKKVVEKEEGTNGSDSE